MGHGHRGLDSEEKAALSGRPSRKTRAETQINLQGGPHRPLRCLEVTLPQHEGCRYTRGGLGGRSDDSRGRTVNRKYTAVNLPLSATRPLDHQLPQSPATSKSAPAPGAHKKTHRGYTVGFYLCGFLNQTVSGQHRIRKCGEHEPRNLCRHQQRLA